MVSFRCEFKFYGCKYKNTDKQFSFDIFEGKNMLSKFLQPEVS